MRLCAWKNKIVVNSEPEKNVSATEGNLLNREKSRNYTPEESEIPEKGPERGLNQKMHQKTKATTSRQFVKWWGENGVAGEFCMK